jgi:hypothetical protein
MADLEINVKGIDATVKSLNRIASSDAIRSAMSASVIEIETYMKKYPPKPAAIQGPAMSPVRFTTRGGKSADFMARSRGWSKNSRGKLYYEGYKRTGKLGQAWTTSVRQTATETVGKVGNAIKYAKWVQAADTQAWMHVGRWRTDRQAIAQFEAKIVKRFEDAIKRAMR